MFFGSESSFVVAVPFDFLIDNQFLRSSLKQWRKTQAVERSVVTIQYVKALVTPSEHRDSLHKDWIKAIATSSAPSSRHLYTVTASFDGSLRLFDAANKCGFVLFCFFVR